MFHRKNLSVLLFILSFSLAFALINDIYLDTMVPGKGFQVKSGAKSSGTAFQYKVANAGDINNDGYEDILIGDFSYDDNRGIVYVIYGTPQASPPAAEFDFSNEAALDYQTTGFTIKGAIAGDRLGWSLSSAGDVNQDSYSDIIIGAYGQDSFRGAAYVIYGGTKSTLKNIDLSSGLYPDSKGFMISGKAANGQFGFSVSSAGDFDNDGYDDILIGAPRQANPQGSNGAGAAYVIYGGPSLTNVLLSSTTLLPDKTGFMVSGEMTGDALGTSVSSAGDLDGDLRGDIMIAAPKADSLGLVDNGAVYIIYGTGKSNLLEFNLASNPLTPSTGFTVTGYSSNDMLGASISAAGDVNGDGRGDIIIGAANQGVAYVIYGNTRTLLADIPLGYVPDARMMKDQESTEIEPSSQDVNHDSRLLTPSPLTSLLSSSQGFVIVGEASPMDYFGYSVSSAGDVNGDDYDDIIIGATGGSSAKGKVYVIYGGENLSGLDLANTNLPQAEIGYSISGNVMGGGFGSSVGCVTGLADNKKMKLLVSEKLTSTQQGTSYILFPSELCSENCEFCDLPGTCSKCSRGYWLKMGTLGDTCEKCSERCTQCTSNTACQDCEIGYTLSKPNTLCQVITTSKSTPFYGSKRENATKDAFDGTSIVAAALSSGSSLPINFGLVAKILRNVKYLDVTVSTELQEAFISWKVNSGFLAAPKSWALKAESKPLPDVFSRYGLAAAFLVNYWKPFVMTLIGLALFAVFKGIEIVVYKGDQVTQKSSIPRKLNLAASNFALTQVYSNLDDVILYFVLDARSTKVDGGFGAFSLILAVILLLVGGLIIGAHIFLLRKYQTFKALKADSPRTQLQRFLYKYENMKLLFDDFKDVTFFTQSFLWIHLTRAVFSSLLFATLFEYPMAQLILLLLLNIGMIIFLFVKKPFKDFLNTFSQLFCEVILLIANICMLGLAIMDQNKSYNLEAMKNMSKAVIILNAILLFGCAILMILGVLKSLYEGYMAKKKAPVGLKALPKLQNHRDKSEADKSQLGTLSTGNYNAGQYETQDYLKTAGNSYNTEGRNNQMEVFDLNSKTNFANHMRMPPSNIMMNQRFGEGNYESISASFSYQADDLINTSNMNLLSNNNNSFMRAESLLRPRRRNNIKMPGGIQTNPKSNLETPTMTGQLQNSIKNDASRLPIVNNNYGGEFEKQRAIPHRR